MKKHTGQQINRVAQIVTKFFEIMHWIATAVAGVALVAALFFEDFLMAHMTAFQPRIGIFGLHMTLDGYNGAVNVASLRIFIVGSMVMGLLMALAYRRGNIWLKTVQGKGGELLQDSPRREELMQGTRTVGLLLLGVVIVGLITGFAGTALLDMPVVAITWDLPLLLVALALMHLSTLLDWGLRTCDRVAARA